MKSFIFLIISVILSYSAIAQDSIKTVPVQKVNIDNIYNDMKAGFQELVATLEGPAEHLL